MATIFIMLVKLLRCEHQHQHEDHQPSKQQGSSNSKNMILAPVNRLITWAYGKESP